MPRVSAKSGWGGDEWTVCYPTLFLLRQLLTNEPESELPEESSTKTSSNAKASPAEVDTPDTPNLNPTTTTSKRGGKRPGAGRGRSHQAPTPSERDEKGSPKDGNDASGSGENNTIPAVTINGTTRRGKRGQHNNHESGESDKDALANGNGVNGSDADAMEISTITGSKKKEPSMAELKRRAAAMLEWVERAKEDLGKSHGSLAGSPSAASPAPVMPVKAEMGSVAEMLQGKLLGWQVEYGAS